MKLIFALLCSFVINSQANNDDEFAIVKTYHGFVRGKTQSSILNQKLFHSFKGIPYAAPPTGNHRFCDPQPVQPWDGIRDALNYGNKCPQSDIRRLVLDVDLPNNVQGNEDCLFVNVFTPNLPRQEGPHILQPVIFYIHGGAFFTGTGDDYFYGPDHLMEGNVVYVSINYRLGALGFLSLEDTEVSGNYGLKDMVKALKWVKRNIAAFGGDPNSVTIIGQSAGGAATSLLMVSPLARGLFHKVVSQSGTLVNGWAIAEQSPRERAFKLGEVLGLQTDNSTKLIEFLRKQDALTLADLSSFAVPDPFDKIPEYSKAIQFAFTPTVEPKEVGASAFLTEDPVKLLRYGRFPKLPLLLGHTSHEYIFLMRQADLAPEVLNPAIENLFIPLPIRNLRVAFDSPEYKHLTDVLKDTYSLNQYSSNTAENYIALQSSIWFILGIEIATRLQLRVSSENTYFYQFSYNGGLNTVKVGKNLTNVLPGAAHADEFCYQFYCRDFKEAYKSLNKKSGDYKTITVLTKLFTNFARTGNPTPVEDEDLDNVIWLPRLKNAPNYLEIGNNLSMNTVSENKINTWFQLIKYLYATTRNEQVWNEDE